MMLNTVSIQPAPAELPPVPSAPPEFHPVAIPKPCCSHTFCGQSCGPVDCIASAVEAISGVGALYSGLTGMKLAAGLLGTAGGLCIVVHILYRKYGDFNAIAARLNSAQQKFQQSLSQQIDLIQQWSGILTTVQGANVELRAQNGNFQESNNRLEATVGKISQELEAFKKANVELKTLNGDLALQVGNLQGANKDLNEKIALFKEQLASFKNAIQNVSRLIPGFENIGKSLNDSVDHLSRTFTDELQEFGKLLTELETHLKTAFESLQKEKGDLESTLQQLEQENTQLRNDATHFEEERQKFEDMENLYQKTALELGQLRTSLTSERGDLEREEKAMDPLMAQLQRGSDAMQLAASALTPLEQGFGRLQGSLSSTLQQELDAEKAIQKQIEELS